LACAPPKPRINDEDSAEAQLAATTTAKMPKQVQDIKQFIEIARRKDASCMFASMV
jgi:hypothetical protein